MRTHLLRVTRPVVEFARLVAAARQEGLRVGWLELPAAAAEPLPQSLSAAANAGVLRAVAVGGGRSVAVKPMRGEPVLRDLLREHFRGCALVLVAGEVDAPTIEPAGDGWRLIQGDVAAERSTEQLVADLRKSRPWPSDPDLPDS